MILEPISSLLEGVCFITGAASSRLKMNGAYLMMIWSSEVGRHWQSDHIIHCEARRTMSYSRPSEF